MQAQRPACRLQRVQRNPTHAGSAQAPGAHGALVSNLCLGTMNFGWITDEAESFRIMGWPLELGINFFDTADVYSWTVEHGTTEEIIGRWLAQGGDRRDAVVLATKVYNPATRRGNLPEPNSAPTRPS